MKTQILSLLLLFGFGYMLQAQEEPEVDEEQFEEEFNEESRPPMFSFGLEFDIAIPLEDFNDNLGGVALGVGGNFLVRTNPASEIPVMAGLSGRIATFDRESQNQIILIDGNTIDARLTTRNSVFMGHGMIRVLPPVNFNIQPFFDGMIGFKNFYTKTVLKDQDAFEEDDTIESYIEQGDWAFSFGGAVGLQVLVGGTGDFYILIEGRCSYLKGNAANYLVRIDDPALQITDPIDAFEEKNSTTDMLIPQLGVSFVF